MAARGRTIPALGALVALALSILVSTQPASAAGPNLLANPSFEWTPLEGSVVVQSPAHGVLPQPVIPTGWAFEGFAGLFDHADNNSDVLGIRRDAQHGQRFVAISIPASGKDEQCVDQADECVPIPVGSTRGETDKAFAIDPSWRPAAPIQVEPGRAYRMGAYASGELMTVDTAAVVKVRWVGASGDVIRVDTVAQRTVTQSDSCGQNEPAPVPQSFCWTPLFGTRTAPAGTVAAVLLLQHSEDVNPFGQVMYDSAFFGLA